MANCGLLLNDGSSFVLLNDGIGAILLNDNSCAFEPGGGVETPPTPTDTHDGGYVWEDAYRRHALKKRKPDEGFRADDQALEAAPDEGVEAPAQYEVAPTFEARLKEQAEYRQRLERERLRRLGLDDDEILLLLMLSL